MMKKTIEPRLLRMKQLTEYCSLSRAHIYNLISEGGFPEGRMLSPGVKAWQRAEIDSWLDQRMGSTAQ